MSSARSRELIAQDEIDLVLENLDAFRGVDKRRQKPLGRDAISDLGQRQAKQRRRFERLRRDIREAIGAWREAVEVSLGKGTVIGDPVPKTAQRADTPVLVANDDVVDWHGLLVERKAGTNERDTGVVNDDVFVE